MTMKEGAVNVDVSHARELLSNGSTLPATWYTDAEHVGREQAAIMEREWQFVCAAEFVAEPGSYASALIAGKPVVVTRAKDGELRGFWNVCRHRGHLVAEGVGKRGSLQCRYHAWTYGLDGRLTGVPRKEELPEEQCALGLIPIHVEQWGPFIFGALKPSGEFPLAALDKLGAVLKSGGLDMDELRFYKRDEWNLACNWKVAVENYIECYHCLTIHRDLNEFVDLTPGESEQEADGPLMLIYSPLRDGIVGRPDLPYDLEGPVVRNDAHLMWPCTTFSMFPGVPNLIIGTWEITSVGLTKRISHCFFGSEVSSEEAEAMLTYFGKVGEDDIQISEATQVGLEAGIITEGRLMDPSEELIRHFQEMVCNSLESAPASGSR